MNQNENFGDGFRHRRQPILVATGAHSEGFTPERTPERPVEMTRFVPRPSVDAEVNELVEFHEQPRMSHWTGSDAESLISQPASTSGFSRNHHLELKRPDSVITTSSIMSSSDTASQAGDSSSIEVPPSVYAISGLYGPISGGRSHSRHHSDLTNTVGEHQPSFVSHIGSVAPSTSRVTSDDVAGASGVVVVASANSANPAFLLPQHPVGKQILTHRRQTSHPAVLQNAPTSAVPPAVAAQSRTLPQQHTSVARHASNPVGQVPVQPQAAVAAVAIVSSQLKGHKRSHSYGYHRNPPMFQQGHRRTGSSVIDTLQTLACNGSGEQELNPQESILQFLENLRKEQQEK